MMSRRIWKKLMIAANEISFTAEADKEEVAEILDSMEEITEWEVQEDTAQEEEAQEKGALPETEPEHAEPEKGALQETAPEAVAPEYGGAPETEPQDTESGEGFAQKEERKKIRCRRCGFCGNRSAPGKSRRLSRKNRAGRKNL
mgnify:CR=1 FL=1